MPAPTHSNSDVPTKLLLCFYAFFLAIGSFLLWGTTGINLADEGFLWYGAQRTLAGETPLRDFQAYEPARYYWVAAWMKLLGSNGLYPLRVSLALFQAVGVAAAVLLVFEGTKNRKLAFLSGPVFLFWMISLFKTFEDVASIFLVGAAFLVLANPTKKSALLGGITLGICTMLGRNLGLYGLAAISVSLCLSVFAYREKKFIQVFLSFGIGILIGLLPLIGQIIFTPGLLDAFSDSVKALIRLGGTNMPLPVPYPWTVSLQDPLKIVARNIAVDTFFILLPLFGVIGLLLLLFRARYLVLNFPLFVAAILTSLPFTHYAFSRADPEHLSCSIYPFLIGIFVIPEFSRLRYRFGIAVVLLGLSWFGIRNYNPRFMDTAELVRYPIGNHNYLITKENMSYLETFKKAAELAGPHERIFVVPHWPAAYPILGQKTPTWESFFLFPRPDDVQEKEAQRLAADPPRVVVIRDYLMDNRDELRFRNTHPLLWKYINENYRWYPMNHIPSDVRMYVKNDYVN